MKPKPKIFQLLLDSPDVLASLAARLGGEARRNYAGHVECRPSRLLNLARSQKETELAPVITILSRPKKEL